MKTLTLSIKQNFFDEIIAGTKREEFREITLKNRRKYFNYVCGGKEFKDENDLPEEGEVGISPIKYDVIKFYTGAYKGKRPFAVVEIKNAEVQIITDEDGKDIVCIEDGEEYLQAQMAYKLGKVIDRSNY